MALKNHLANILTGFRILGSMLLLFIPVFSAAFYSVYLLCGFTDIIDGTVARMTGSAGRFGEKLDTAADIVFAAAALIRFLPNLPIPLWLWIWGGGIAVIRIGNILLGYVFRKQFTACHTILNKVTGLALFLLPMTGAAADFRYGSMAVCAVATAAAIQEGIYIVKKECHV